MPSNKSLLILSSSLVLGILFAFFVDKNTTILKKEFRTTDQETLYQSGIKEGRLAYLAKENMFPIDDNLVYANCTTIIIKSEEEAKGFIDGYHSFDKSN
jgi:hypothetical protein